jgi:hypothetical protein
VLTEILAVLLAEAGCAPTLPIMKTLSNKAPHSRPANVTTAGFDLRVNGNPMVIKGMNYSPVPIGALPGNPPYGDCLTPEYMNVWLPDIESMRAAGVTAIKLYAGNPALNAGAPGSSGNWKQFLDTCYNAGTNPVYVVMFSYVQGDVIAAGGASYDQYLSDYENLVSSTVNHPAILGYCVGNEIFGGDVTSNPQFWINFGALLNRAKQAGQSQGATAFLMTATNDNYTPTDAWPAIKQGESSGQLNNLDAWGINIYRGPLFGGAGNSAFVQYKDLMTSLNKTRPLILGEWGTPHSTRAIPVYGNDGSGGPPINLDTIPQGQMGQGEPFFDAMPTSEFLATQWQTIKVNVGAGQVCVGGFIFEWCDEYWKGADANTQLGGPSQGFSGGAFAGGYWDEAWFGISSAVDQSSYGSGQQNISRTPFAAYAAVQAFYT